MRTAPPRRPQRPRRGDTRGPGSGATRAPDALGLDEEGAGEPLVTSDAPIGNDRSAPHRVRRGLPDRVRGT